MAKESTVFNEMYGFRGRRPGSNPSSTIWEKGDLYCFFKADVSHWQSRSNNAVLFVCSFLYHILKSILCTKICDRHRAVLVEKADSVPAPGECGIIRIKETCESKTIKFSIHDNYIYYCSRHFDYFDTDNLGAGYKAFR